jgi:hypothetical protein
MHMPTGGSGYKPLPETIKQLPKHSVIDDGQQQSLHKMPKQSLPDPLIPLKVHLDLTHEHA